MLLRAKKLHYALNLSPSRFNKPHAIADQSVSLCGGALSLGALGARDLVCIHRPTTRSTTCGRYVPFPTSNLFRHNTCLSVPQ